MPADAAHEVEKLKQLRLMIRGAVMDGTNGAAVLTMITASSDRAKAFIVSELAALREQLPADEPEGLDKGDFKVAAAAYFFDLLIYLSDEGQKAAQ